jgi:hypothetical protein
MVSTSTSTCTSECAASNRTSVVPPLTNPERQASASYVTHMTQKVVPICTQTPIGKTHTTSPNIPTQHSHIDLLRNHKTQPVESQKQSLLRQRKRRWSWPRRVEGASCNHTNLVTSFSQATFNKTVHLETEDAKISQLRYTDASHPCWLYVRTHGNPWFGGMFYNSKVMGPATSELLAISMRHTWGSSIQQKAKVVFLKPWGFGNHEMSPCRGSHYIVSSH